MARVIFFFLVFCLYYCSTDAQQGTIITRPRPRGPVSPYRYVHCQLLAPPGTPQRVLGYMGFRQKWFESKLDVRYNLRNFDTRDNVTEHGIHIHEFGDFRVPCGSSHGMHYNPEGTFHGSPANPMYLRHVGDLGNIHENSDGTSVGEFSIPDFPPITGKYGIVGRSMIIKAEPDDFGFGGNEYSLRTGGGSLPGISCCILGESSGARVWF